MAATNAKAQNLKRTLRQSYDDVLAEHDVIVMPTIPFRATEIPAPDCSREDYVELALNMLGNTAPFDVSGHPAISVPWRHGRRPAGRIDDRRQAI